jgi:hypothetical protein
MSIDNKERVPLPTVVPGRRGLQSSQSSPPPEPCGDTVTAGIAALKASSAISRSSLHVPAPTKWTWTESSSRHRRVSARYANEPTAAFFEIYNEPAALEYLGGSWSFADWKQHADSIVAVLRQHAPEAIPVVGGLNWCYDFSAGGDRPFADPDIALSDHPYPGRAKTNRPAAWDAAFGYLSAHYPFILTEFGFDPNDQIEPYGTYRADISYGREILHYAQDKSMSWTAFVFFNDPGWPMPLFSDWETLTPTYSGQFFKDVLAGVDIDVAGMTAGDGGAVDVPDAPAGETGAGQ